MNGWVFIDKPKNLTSFQVIKALRKVLKIKKIGHAGTLDPFATGILAVAIGEATKSIKYFNKTRHYSFKVVFGEEKDTDDITGKTIKSCNKIPTKHQIDQCLKSFLGEHEQVPPKYSAIKIRGERAYKLARSNYSFEIEPRIVRIIRLECHKTSIVNEFSFLLECSSGTYVRSIARDLGNMLGTCGYVSELRRIKIGQIDEKDIILLDKFLELVHIGDHFEVMHSIKEVLDDIPAVRIGNELRHKFQNGLSFNYFNDKSNIDYLLVENNKDLLGVGKAIEGKIKPIRLFNL